MYIATLAIVAALGTGSGAGERSPVWTSQPAPMPGENGFPFVKVCVETTGSADAIVGYTYAENWSKILAAAGEPPAVDRSAPGHAKPPAGIKLKLAPPCVSEEQTVVVYCVQPGTYYFGNDMALVDSSPLNAGCWEFMGWSY